MDEPTDETTEDALITEVRGLRGDVRTLNRTVADERRGRKITSRLALVLAVLATGLTINWVREGRTTCAEKRGRAEVADQRSLIVLDGAIGSEAAGIPLRTQKAVRAEVQAKIDALPPPC